MNSAQRLLILALAAGLLVGCGSFKKLTGQRNDTVLPGERENILPPEQQVNPKPGQSAADAAPLEPEACDPTVDLNCDKPVDQEATADDAQ